MTNGTCGVLRLDQLLRTTALKIPPPSTWIVVQRERERERKTERERERVRERGNTNKLLSLYSRDMDHQLPPPKIFLSPVVQWLPSEMWTGMQAFPKTFPHDTLN